MSESAEKLFTDVEKFVADSRALLESGEVLQLENLDGEVKRLCEAVLRLSQEERVEHAQKLQKLLHNLTELGNEMMKQRDELAAQIQSLPQSQKAHVAYQKADATDDYGKKKDKE